MSLYEETELIEFRGNKKITKVIFSMVSCMCDNISFVKVEKCDSHWSVAHYNNNCALSFNNLQCDNNKEEIIWAAENGNWPEVVRILNSGTSKIFDIRSK